jgi:hypothetical protein
MAYKPPVGKTPEQKAKDAREMKLRQEIIAHAMKHGTKHINAAAHMKAHVEAEWKKRVLAAAKKRAGEKRKYGDSRDANI